MIYALDTNILSYLLRPSQNKEMVQRFFDETRQNAYVIPPLCYYEVLWYLLILPPNKNTASGRSFRAVAASLSSQRSCRLRLLPAPCHDVKILAQLLVFLSGASIRKNATVQREAFEGLMQNSSGSLSMGAADFIKAAEIRASLEAKGTPVGANDADIFIAAFYIVNHYTLVTNNTRHFALVDGLQIVNWK